MWQGRWAKVILAHGFLRPLRVLRFPIGGQVTLWQLDASHLICIFALQELLRLAPTILLIAGYVWFTRRQMGGLGGQGPGGRGLFNVGKAQVRTICMLCSLTSLCCLLSFDSFVPLITCDTLHLCFLSNK